MSLRKCILIPMRGGSKGIPRKNLVEFEGKPLLHHILQSACASGHEVWVSTEDAEIKEESLKFDVKVDDRALDLAEDLSTDFDVFLDFLRRHPGYDYVIHLRATWPRMTPEIIADAVEFFEKNYSSCTSMRSVEKAKEIPWKMWFVDVDDVLPTMRPVLTAAGALGYSGHRLEYFSHPRQSLRQAYYQNAAIDIVKTNTICDQLSTVGHRPIAYIMDGMVEGGVDIDAKEDLGS